MIFGHKDTDVFSHNEHKGRKGGKGCEMSERNESFKRIGRTSGTRGAGLPGSRVAGVSLARWAAVAAVAAGAWLGGAGDAEAYQTVYWRNDAGTTNWWDGNNPWYRSSDGWWIGRPDYKTYQNNTDIGPNIVHLDNANKPNMSVNGAYFQIGQLWFENATARTLLARENGGMDFYNDGGSLDPKIENSSTGSHTIDAPIYIHDQALQINPVSGNLTFNKLIGNGGNWIDVWGNNGKTLIFKGAISGAGGMYIHENSHVTNTVAHTYTGLTTVHAGRLGFMTNGAVASDIAIESGGQMVMNKAATYPWSYAGNLSGAGSITKQGNFMWTLTGESSDYTGTMTIEAGPVTISRAGNWGSASANILMPGTGRSLRLSGGVTVKAGVSLGGATTNLLNLSGDNKITGTVTVGKNATIVTNTAGSLTMSSMNLASNIYFRGAGTTVVNNMATPKAGVFLWNEAIGGNLVLGGASSPAVNNIYLTVTNGATLTFSNTASAVAFTNANVTNYTGGKIILRKPTTVRQILIQNNANLDMYVLSNSEAAHFGVIPNQNGANSAITFNTPGHTVYLKYTDGFDPTEDACWMIYEGRNANCISQTEANRITVNTDDLVAHGAEGTFSGPLAGGTNSYNKTAGSAVYVTYTAPVTEVEQAALTLDGQASEVTKTYAGAAFSLPVGGGSGTGAISATKTGGTGTGTVGVSGNNVTLTVTACGTFIIKVTKAASTGYLAKEQTFTVTVEKGTQTISGLSNISKTYGDANFNLSASAVGAVTYSISPSSVATVSGSTVTIAGAGTATITANAAATALYNANSATATLTVEKKNPTVTASVSPASIRVGGTATLSGTTDSGATLTYSTSSSSIASLSGTTVTGAGYGTATLTVNSPATANYNAGSATCTITVLLVKPTASDTITGVQNKSTTGIRVNFSQPTGHGNGTLLLIRQGEAITATPTDGSGPGAVAPNNSGAWNGTTFNSTAPATYAIVNSVAATRTYKTLTGMVPAAHYYVQAYSYNLSGSAGTGNHSYAYGPAGGSYDFWLYATEPTGQASGLTAGTVGSRKASMTWTAGSYTAASGESSSMKTLLIVVPSGSSVTAPTDGVTYSAGDTIGAGTVAFAGAGTSGDVTGLEPEHTYTVYAYAYAEGGDATTANYLTTSPASRSITTTQSQGPNVWATGVTTTNYLLNWTPVAGETTGYDVALDENSAFSSPWRATPFTNNFTEGEGWERSETSTGSGAWLTVPSGTASGNEEKWYLKGVQRRTGSSDTSTVGGVTDTGYLYLTTTGDYVDTPVLYGDLSEIVVGWRRGGGDRSLRIDILKPDRSDFKTGVASWSIAGTATAGVISTNIFTNSIHMPGGAGYRIRFYNSSSTAGTIYLHHIHLKVAGSEEGYPGYGVEVGGLTGGSTYYAKVRKNPDGDWSDDLGVKAGVLPTGLGATATRNSVTFTWSGANSPSAYAIQVSKTGAPSSWADKSAGTAALTLDSFGSKDWKYIGATATTSSGTLGTAPGYASGHIPGVAGNGLESKSFPIAGMTGVRVSFTVEPFNLNQTGGQLSDGRVEVYYQIDDGNWNFLGTAAPVSTSTGANAAFDVPAGALAEGNRVAFRLVAPNAHKYGTSYFISPRLTNVKVSRVSKGSGDFSESSAGVDYKIVNTTQAGTSYTVNVGGSGTSVYFRVQALQGSQANPTAKSVWVEASGTTTAYTAPSAITFSSVTRNSMTVSWTAGDTTDFSKYVLQRSTASDFSSGVTSYDVTGGATTKDITGLAGNTKYYFRVKAVGSDSQESAWSATANQTTAVYTAPSAITFSSVTRNSMTVSWTAGNTKDFSKYVLQQSTSSDFSSGVTSYDVTGGGTTKAVSGLTAGTTYYFRVKAVGSDTPQESAWSATASQETSGFAGPTPSVEGTGRYEVTATWPAYDGEDAGLYNISYKVQLTGCANAGASPTDVSTCPESGRSWGSSTTDWTYQREYSGNTASSYPKYEDGVHKLWGQYASTTTQPGIESPEMDLTGYVKAYVEFSHNYVNRTNCSEMALYYKVGDGSWAKWADVPHATTYSKASATKRNVELPASAIGQSRVKVKLVTVRATNYDSNPDPDVTTYLAQGASVYGVKVTARGAGGGDYTCAFTTDEYPVNDTNFVFNATSLTGDSHLTGLTAGSNYYVHVQTVLTPKAGGAATTSAWGEDGMGTTAAPMLPPAEVRAENVKQTHLTVAWDEAGEATDSTLYKVQISSCLGTPWTSVAVQPSSTNTDLSEVDDWIYVGGGTAVSSGQQAYITGRGLYPAYADKKAGATKGEYSLVLAGDDEPGLESVAFSTVGATNATLTFGSGRWYSQTNSDAHSSKLTLMYSIDNGSSWVAWTTNGVLNTVAYAYENVHDYEIPAEVLGHSQVKVRIVAEEACLRSDGEPMGAAVSAAKVTLKGASGDYTSGGCLKDEATGLSHEQLSHVFSGLSPDTMYYFRVAASDGTQYGEWVNGSAKTLAVPATPEAPWAEDVGTHGFTMLWKAVEGADAYNVKVYTNGNEGSPVFAQDGVGGTAIEVTGLNPDTTYYMKVQSKGDGETNGSWSPAGTQTTLDGVHVTGVHAENETLNSLDVVWDVSSGMTYKLDWGDADTSSSAVAEVLSCPNKTLGRSDSSNEWYYVGGNNSWPGYYVGTAANDKGHALIYKAGEVAPGLQSRWFSTRGASEVEVSFLHGRFNAKANSAVTLSYSTDMGKTWSVAGTTAQSANTVPTDPVTMTLPAAALGQKTVAIRLSAEDADGNKGAHINNVKVRILSGQGTTRGSNISVSGGRYTLSGANVTSGKRYWFKITGTETRTGTSADMTASGATHEAPATYWKSQGFDGYDGGQALSYTTKFLNLSDGSVATGSGLPTVQVVDDENPMYGHKALRFSGSSSASVFGVAEFDVGSIGRKSGVLTIPFAAKDLGANDYLYFCYSTDNGTTWQAPVTNVTTMGGAKMTRIGIGGSDKPNQNWPYNRGLNGTTRPQGNAFVWEFPADVLTASTLKFRIAFCGQSGSADHYYYVDNISLLANAGIPYDVSATAMEDGTVKLEWTPPAGQDVIIVCGKDQRNAPPSPLELASLGSEYHVVMNGDSAVWPEGTTVAIDQEVAGGDRYYYYFYGVLNGQIGQTPAVAWVVPKGMVMAIASQGFDGWDVHPWEYTKGRVTHPVYYADYGWWVNERHYPYLGNVEFVSNSFDVSDAYLSFYERTSRDQVAVSGYTNYFGTNSLRLSGGGGSLYNKANIVWTNNSGYVKTNSYPYMGTNNAAVLFQNVDLSGYKNVEFSMHYAGTFAGGGNYLHLAISTNGGTEWLGFSNQGAAGWTQVKGTLGYGLQLQAMSTAHTGETVDFYSQELADYGNPFVLKVPDSVTQFMARVMFYDSNGRSDGWREAAFFIDEVRLTGQVAMETPRPVITNVAKTTATVEWGAIPDATSYNVRVTQTEKTPLVVKLNEAFVVSNFVNGWTTNGNPKLQGGADHGGSGYGLTLDGNGYGVVSPEVGAASSLTFWAKKASGSTTRKLVVYSKDTTDGTDGGEWVKLAEIAASALTTSHVLQTVPLPSRQYQKVKICVEGGTGNVYVDEIELLGGGNYTTTTRNFTTSATSMDLTGLLEGERFWVSVQAYGTPAGVPTYSGWGETAEYTPGTVYLQPDGFEMVRMWGNASSSAQVLVVSSAGDDPIGTPEGGVTYVAGNTLPGGGTVIARWTKNYTENNNFEHVVPANAQVNYAVFWKRGAYYEGRYDTNFWMGQYGCDAADAFAQTNGMDVGSAGWSSNGKGWGANWTVTSNNITWMCAEAVSNSAQPFGLLKNTQLYGAGGNMLALYPGDSNGDRKVEVTRQLETTFGKNDMWWGMFTMKMTWSGSKKWAGIQLLDASGNNKASIGKLWNDNKLGIEGSASSTSSYEMGNDETHIVVFLWDNVNQKMLVAGKKVNSATDPIITASTPAPGQTGGWAWQTEIGLSMNDITQVRFVAENSGEGCLNNVYFDEFRIGPTWDSLIKEPAPPNPVTSAHAIPDGKELVRLDWTYGASDGDHPAAGGVLVLDKATAWTEADIASIKPVNGQRYSVGQSVGGATVAYMGGAGWTVGTTQYQDLVVDPGTRHYFHFFAHSGYIYTNGVAASGTAPSQYPVEMGTYLENEHVDTFSYTNATLAGTTWKGGVGFENPGESDIHYWGHVEGTWTAMLPSSQPGHVDGMPTFGPIEGYPTSAGNLVKLTNPGSNAGGSMRRDLPREITASNTTNFYVAFRMAYQYEGANKWAGLSLLDASGTERGFVGKGAGSYWYTLCVEGGGNKSWGNDLRGYDGDASKTYLVIMRYSFENNSLSAMTVEQGGQVPNYEPTVWPASIGVSITGIKKLMLQAGGIGSGVTIGDVWFDELRWGTSWTDILSGVCPDSIEGAWWQQEDRVNDLRTNYLGNSGTFLIRSTPTGFGQEAWLTIDWTGGASDHTVTTNQLAWLTNEVSGGVTYTWWSNKVQVVETGKVGGASANWPATAKVTAMNADCEATSETTRLTVKPLVKPTKLRAVRDPVKTNSVINVSWKPWTGTLANVDTTTKDVLVVRFTGSSEEDAKAKAAVAANQPKQGRAYMAGDSIGEGTVVWLGGDGGAVTNTSAKGLMPNTWYAFALYTENYSYYSPYNAAAVVATNTAEGGHTIEIDGDPTDWYGEAPDTLNTAWVSLGEFIWKDKTGEERHSASGDTTVANTSSDIDEFRVYADRDWVYFLVKMTDITASNLPYVSVGMDSRRAGTSTKMNWLGDESMTEIGSNYWWTSEAAHYPQWQLAVHHVTDWGVQVEEYDLTSTDWYAPQTEVDDGSGTPKRWAAAITNGAGKAVEFRVPRADIGLSGLADGATITQRFTVATFKNTSVWNNQGAATAEIYGGTSKAVDSLAIAPQRPAGKEKPDNDYLMDSWNEDISDGKLDFWVDVTFNANGIVENQRPTPPVELVFPEQDARLKSSPTFQWKRGGDEDGRVTGYMLEVSTNADFNDLNGAVELRVNVAGMDSPADTGSTVYSYDWNGAHQQTLYYWRVRSRDNGGRLSVATNGVFWVDEDGDGPVAVLKYVGTDVQGYLDGDYAQIEKLYPESLLSVTDADIERVQADPSLKFGFVIEWTDPNGVYATNQIRADASGTRVDGFDTSYHVGDWAWNITSEDGRVSPNWDLVEFHTTLTDRSANTNTFPKVSDSTGKGKWTTNYWDEMGCWGYQWGYDDAFMVGMAGTDKDQTRGFNGAEVITNLVRSAFDMHEFDPTVDYYLTVSAEDCTTWKESGSGWWDDGSWDSFKARGATDWPGDDYSSGWCKDGPNRARNVTTNMLLEIRVRDNDVTPPGASVSLWSGKGMVVTTNDASGVPDPLTKQLTLEEGSGLPVWTATDEELVGRPLAFHFNVYDSSMTGIRTGTVATASVTKGSRTTTMTNSSFIASLEQRVDGARQTVTWTNWDKYSTVRSVLATSGEGMGEGTGADTVLTWYWPAATGLANIEAFWPRAARGVDGQPMTVATNEITLSLWDLDNNRDGDQMGDDVTLGYLKITDDDTDDPVLTSVNVTGTGIGAEAGTLGSWPLSKNSDTAGTSELGATVGAVSGIAGTTVAGAADVGLSGAANNGGAAPNNGDAWAALGKYKGFQMTVTAPAGLSYKLASVSFDAQIRGSYPARGPQNWGLYSSANTYATPIASGTFDLTGEENEDGTMTYAVSNWTGYAAGSTAAAASGTVTYRLMMWRTDALDSNSGAPSIYCKNLTLVGVLTDSRYTTAVTDGDLANGTATYTLNTHDVGSGILASGKAYPTNEVELANGAPEITFGRQSGNTPVNAKKLTITSPTPVAGKVAKGSENVEVSGTVTTADKKLIDVNTNSATWKSSPYSYRLTATVWDADTDRRGDTRTTTTMQANIPVYDDDNTAPVRGSGMQGGALGALLGDLATFPPSVGSGTNREYRISDRQLQEMITAGKKLYIGASFYDYSGWARPTLKVMEGRNNASSILTVASGDGTVPAFTPVGTTNDSSATAYWELNKTTAMSTLNANIAAGGFSATYAIQATSIADLDDDRQDASGNNIDSRSAENMNLGLVTFLDNDTGLPKVQTNYTARGGAPQWSRTFVGFGAGPQVAGWEDALLNTELTNDTSRYFVTEDAINRVYDSQLTNASAASPFQIRLPTYDLSGSQKGQSAQGVQVGVTQTTPAAGGVTLTNSYVEIGGTKNWANWATNRSSKLNTTKMAGLFPTNVWAWESFTTNEVGTWLPSGQTVMNYALKAGLYDADSDRNGDQKFNEVNLGTLRVQDDDTTPPGAVEIDFSASTGISAGAEDRYTAAWTNNVSGVQVKFGKVEDGEPTVASGDLHKSGVAGYRIGTTLPNSWAWGTALENTTTNGEVVTASLGGAMTAEDQGMLTRYVAAVDSDADRPGDQLVGTPDSFTVAFDITLPTAVKFGTQADGGNAHSAGASTDTVDDPTTQFDLTWYVADVSYASVSDTTGKNPKNEGWFERSGTAGSYVYTESADETVISGKTYYAQVVDSMVVGPDDRDGDSSHYTRIPETIRREAAAHPMDVLSPWYSYKVYYKEYDPQTDVINKLVGAQTTDDYIWREILDEGAAELTAANGWTNVTKETGIRDPSARTENSYENQGMGEVRVGVGGTQKLRLYDLDFDREYLVVIRGVDKAGNEGPIGQFSWATNNTIKFAVTQGVMRARAQVEGAFPGKHNMKAGDKGAVALYWMAAGQKDVVRTNATTHVVTTNREGNVTKDYDLIYRDATSFNESTNNTWAQVGVSVRTNWFVDAGALEQSGNMLRFYRASYKNRWRQTNPDSGNTQRPLMSEDVYAMTAVPLLEGQNYVSLHGYGYTNTLGGIFGTDPTFWPTGSDSGDSVRLDVYTNGFTAGNATASRTYWLSVDSKTGTADWRDADNNSIVTEVIDTNIFKHGVSIVLPEISNERRDLVVTNNGVAQNAIYWHPVLLVPTNNILAPTPTASFTNHVIHGSTRTGVMWNLCSFILPMACHPAQLGLPYRSEAEGGGGFAASTTTQPSAKCDVIYAYDSVHKKLRDRSGMFLDVNGDWRSFYSPFSIIPASSKPLYPNDMIIINTRSGGDDWDWVYSPEDFYNLPTRWGGW